MGWDSSIVRDQIFPKSIPLIIHPCANSQLAIALTFEPNVFLARLRNITQPLNIFNALKDQKHDGLGPVDNRPSTN